MIDLALLYAHISFFFFFLGSMLSNDAAVTCDASMDQPATQVTFVVDVDDLNVTALA